MNAEVETKKTGTVEVENVGGIEEATVEFPPGCTLLVGRNATYRTSFLQSVMAALGSDDISIKGDADEAHVTLSIGNEAYHRTLRQRGGDVLTEGDPYLEESELADLFAFLLESNEARRAVSRGDDLRELIVRPIDVDEIEAQIDRLTSRRDELERQLSELSELQKRLPELEEKRSQLTDEIEEKRAELAEIEAELEAADADVDERREEKEQLQAKFDELRSTRETLDDVRYDLETERESLEALREERHELESERDALPEAPAGDIEHVRSSIERLREQKQALESELTEIQDVIRFNEDLLSGTESELLGTLTADDDRSVTDRLLEDDEVTCWTCGSQVDQESIESTVDTLRSLSTEKVGEINSLEDELDELTSRKDELKRTRRKRERIGRRLDEIERDVEETEAEIERLQDRRESLQEEVKSTEKEVEELEDEQHYGDVLERHREANSIEYELGQLESKLDRVTDEISSIEDRITERDETETRLEEIRDEIVELRTKIEDIEETAIEEFNEEMNAVLEMLDYDNIDRIWIERLEKDGRRTGGTNTFELHVVRKTDSGVAYEDTIDHLSESEREVTGLVFALAGYLAHDVHEEVPFILLDSVEAIDADRIAKLVQYLSEYTEYLLVALLPEDAAALPDGYARVTEI